MRSRQERINYIARTAEGCSSEDNERERVPWRGGELHLPVLQLDISYLMFSIQNFRTNRQQIEYQVSHNETPEIFSDPETTLAQEAQYEILNELLETSGKDFLRDLELRGQKNPAIITHDGYLINGNRRIAALKRSGEKYADCVVLPHFATRDDYYSIEQELQLSQEFKQEYHWINVLLSTYHGLEVIGYSVKEMAKRLRVEEKDVIEARTRKILIDEFLEWRKIPGRYDYVMLDDAQQVFSDLENYVKKKNVHEAQKQQAKLAVFNLIENRPDEGRLYGHVKKLFKHFPEIQKHIIEEGALDVGEKSNVSDGDSVAPSPAGNKVVVTNEPVLEELFEGLSEESVETGTGDIESLNDAAKSSENSAAIVGAINAVDAGKKEKGKNESLYDGVDRALQILAGLSCDSSSTKLEETKRKLNHIIKKASSLVKEIEDKQ